MYKRGDYTNLNALSFFFSPFFLCICLVRMPVRPTKHLKQKLTHYHLTVKTFLQKSQKTQTNLVNLNRPVQFRHA